MDGMRRPALPVLPVTSTTLCVSSRALQAAGYPVGSPLSLCGMSHTPKHLLCFVSVGLHRLMVPRREATRAGRKYGFRARTFVQEIPHLEAVLDYLPAATGSRFMLLEVTGLYFDGVPQLQHPPSSFVRCLLMIKA